MKKRTRYDMDYKIKMWWYRLTWKDAQKAIYGICSIIGMTIVFALILLLLAVFPAILH